MRLSIVPEGSLPVYRQLYEEIFSQIVSGELAPGTALPPIRTVARELGISVITVRSAWDALENDGLISTRAGSGCSVAAVNADKLRELKEKAVSEQIKALTDSAKKLCFTEDELIEQIKKSFEN